MNHSNKTSIKIGISILITLAFSLSFFLLIDLFDQIIFYQKIVSFNNIYYEPTPFNPHSLLRITFAFFTLLLGVHYGLQYYLSSNVKWPFLVKKRVLHDTQFLPWIVFFVFGKFIAQFNVFPYFIPRNKHINVFSDLVDVICVLLILIGFFVCTQHLRRYKILKPKQTVLGFILMFGLSLLYTSINMVNKDNLEKDTLKHNIYFTHKIKIPFSHYSKKVIRKTLVDHYGIAFDSLTNKTAIFTRDEKLGKEDVHHKIYESRDIRREEEIRYLSSNFLIDSKLPLDSVLPFLYEFHIHNADRVAFQTNKEDYVFSYKLQKQFFYDYKKNMLSQSDIERHNSIPLPPAPPKPPMISGYLPGCMASGNRIEIRFTKQGIEYNNIIVSIEDLKEVYLEQESTDFTIFYTLVDYTQTVQEYISNKSLMYKMYHEIRNEASIMKYGKSYSDLEKNKMLEIRKIHPINFVEFGLKNLSEKRVKDFIEEQKVLRYKQWDEL
ncbi:MAG: hypothetical protein ACPGSD_16965 [Flavobacteriales bacterium]